MNYNYFFFGNYISIRFDLEQKWKWPLSWNCWLQPIPPWWHPCGRRSTEVQIAPGIAYNILQIYCLEIKTSRAIKVLNIYKSFKTEF